MGNKMDDFELFLYFNYPEDWLRFTAPGVTVDVKAAIISRRASSYQIWQEIPDWIKKNYGNRIPSEVLNGNEPVKEFIAKETQSNKEEEKQTNDLVNFSVMALAAGYAAGTVVTLTNNRMIRQGLIEKYGVHMPKDIFEKYLETRMDDIAAIKEDWQKNQPEKYLFSLIKELSREQKRAERGTVDKAESARKVTAMQKELEKFAANLSSKSVKLKVVDYLRARPQQMALKHLSPEALNLFTGIMQKQGIKIEAMQTQKTAEKTVASVDSLTTSLKNAFMQREQVENLMRQQARYVAPDFARRQRTSTSRRRGRSVVATQANVGKSESSI